MTIGDKLENQVESHIDEPENSVFAMNDSNEKKYTFWHNVTSHTNFAIPESVRSTFVQIAI